MLVEFEKWHGCGNDFIVMHLDRRQHLLLESIIRNAVRICRRDGTGIGADGLLLLTDSVNRSEQGPYGLTIVNSDGSIAQNCGNGIRCVGASLAMLASEDLRGVDHIEGFDLIVGDRELFVRSMMPIKHAEQIASTLFFANMGRPELRREDASQMLDSIRQIIGRYSLKLDIESVAVCDLGNTHLVLFCRRSDGFHDAIRTIGPLLQQTKYWNGVNVHLASAESIEPAAIASKGISVNPEDGYRVSVWERGAGPTQACGSGACAVAVCAMTDGLIDRQYWLPIAMPGGLLYVRQSDEDQDVELAGPAEFVFRGSIDV
jgi:diaminopimelate epimerase